MSGIRKLAGAMSQGNTAPEVSANCIGYCDGHYQCAVYPDNFTQSGPNSNCDPAYVCPLYFQCNAPVTCTNNQIYCSPADRWWVCPAT